MKKKSGLSVIIIGAILVIALYVVVAVVYLPKLGSKLKDSFGGFSPQSSRKVQLPQVGPVPKTPPQNSIAIFDFRSKGNKDAEAYAYAFPCALSERLRSAPTSVFLQPGLRSLQYELKYLKAKTDRAVPDELALRAGKALGVRFVVSGDFEMAGNQAVVTTYLVDTLGKQPKQTIKVTGPISSLPVLQTQTVSQVLAKTGVSPEPKILANLKKPNFTRIETLLDYNSSAKEKSLKKRESVLWRMVSSDPTSSFAAASLLTFYMTSSRTGREIEKNARLQEYLASLEQRFPNNTDLYASKGVLLIDQYKFSKAEELLRELVAADPKSTDARSMLCYVALWRENGALAKKEAETLVQLWPTNAEFHAIFANAYTEYGYNIRHSHDYEDLSVQAQQQWDANCQKAYKEASIAVALNPDCYYGLQQLTYSTITLGAWEQFDKAFKEITRIEPKDMTAYEYYARYSPGWPGGSRKQRESLRLAEKAFGKDSSQYYILKGKMLMDNACPQTIRSARPNRLKTEIMRCADLAVSKSGNDSDVESEALQFKCEVLKAERQRNELYKLSKYGFEKWGSFDWRAKYGDACAYRWDDLRDRKALETCRGLYEVYAKELPFDPHGYIQWGWCMSHLGHPEEAKKLFNKALEVDPYNRVAREKLTYVE